MKIEDILRCNDIDTYRRLKRLSEKPIQKPGPIKLGDSVENLMRADSYKRCGRRIRQVKWG